MLGIDQPELTVSPFHASEKKPTGEKKLTPGEIRLEGFSQKEDKSQDFLTSDEKRVFKNGFQNLKQLLAVADDGIQKMILTSFNKPSCFVGFQADISLDEGEAGIINQLLNRAGGGIKDQFAFFDHDGQQTLFNLPASEVIMKKFQSELKLSIPDRPLSREETLDYLTKLLRNPDLPQAHLALGLLSGYPLDDCLEFVSAGRADKPSALYKAEIVTDPDQRWPKPSIGNLNPGRYFTRDEINIGKLADGTTHVEAMGLNWLTGDVISQGTKDSVQKLWQVDRELGLIDFLNKERKSFNKQTNIWRIKAVKLLNKITN